MEQQKTTRIRNIVRGLNKTVYTIANFYRSLANADFREFKNMEYASVKGENVTDLPQLRYIKRLDLAKNGYIDDDLRSLLAFQKEKNRLLNREIRVLSLGQVEFVEKENVLAVVKLGYDQKDKCFKIAYSDYDNIPKWKHLEWKELIGYLSRIHPKASHALEFRHIYIENESLKLQKEDVKRLASMYNHFVRVAFDANKYVGKSILKPSETLLSDSLKYMGKQFFLELEPNKPSILTLTDVNSEYLVFQSFLKTVPKPAMHYFTREEFQNRFLDSQIDLLAKLKFGLHLGTKNGILYIAKADGNNSGKPLKWEKFDEALVSDTLSAKAKYYLSKTVITDKNFCIEKDAIVLQSESNRAYLKKHFRTNEWHFAERKSAGQDMDFRPVTSEMQSYIQHQYGQCHNFNQVLRELRMPNQETKSKYQNHGQKV